MRSASAKAGSGRIVVALLGLLFMKALGDVLVAQGSTRGKQAEAFEPMWEPAPDRSLTPAGNPARPSGAIQQLDEAADPAAAN